MVLWYWVKAGEKVIRILLLLLPAMLIYLLMRGFKKLRPEQYRVWSKRLGWILLALLLLILLGSGKLNAIFALIGVGIAFLVRLIPVILNYAPQLHRLWQIFGKGPQSQNSQQQNAQRPVRNGRMSQAEALDVLGLKPGASRQEIIDAHRKLISRLHPDKGGSDYLAAQINLAKSTLLDKT